MPIDLTAIVPTIGRSSLLEDCLRRLRAEGGQDLEIVVVAQGGNHSKDLQNLVDRVDVLPENLGFTGGCNHVLARVDRKFVALVNDDLLVEPGWMSLLLETIRRDPSLAAVQGLNLQLERPDLVDGFGIGWNRFWRPVQLGHGAAKPQTPRLSAEVFGTSATAAIYRTEALRAAALGPGEVFDSRLESYYEDVDLAIRLRQKGWEARSIPSARALHAGGGSSRDRAASLQRLAFSNRLLVSARLFGRSFWRVLPLLLLRDVVEIAAGIARLRASEVGGSVGGWLRAIRLFGHFGHLGASTLPIEELERFRVGSAATALSREP